MGEKHDFIEKRTLKTGKLSRGNILMSLGLSILALVILFVTILCYQYTNTSIEGKWACNSLNQQLEENCIREFSNIVDWDMISLFQKLSEAKLPVIVL